MHTHGSALCVPQVQLRIEGKTKTFGTHDTALEAALAATRVLGSVSAALRAGADTRAL